MGPKGTSPFRVAPKDLGHGKKRENVAKATVLVARIIVAVTLYCVALISSSATLRGLLIGLIRVGLLAKLGELGVG